MIKAFFVPLFAFLLMLSAHSASAGEELSRESGKVETKSMPAPRTFSGSITGQVRQTALQTPKRGEEIQSAAGGVPELKTWAATPIQLPETDVPAKSGEITESGEIT